MIEPRDAAALAALPWVPTRPRQSVSLAPLELVERTLAGLAERGVVVRDGDVFDTTVPHEPRAGRNHDTES